MTGTRQPRAKERQGAAVALAEPAMLAVFLLYLLYQFVLSHVEGDQAYLLYAAQQVLHGVQLDGPLLIETNPPLIVWSSMIPAALARWLHMDVVLALRLVVLSMLAGSAAWGWRLLRFAGIAEDIGRQACRALWAATFLLIVITQPAEFGQREQLLLALFLPYLLAVGTDAMRQLATGERIALGLCAGLAVCFKPQHLLTLVCLEVFLAVYSRTLRRLWSAEVIAAVATGLLYVAAVQVFTPAYLSVVEPLLQSTYWALGEYTYAEMVLHVGRWLTLTTVLCVAAWLLLKKRLLLSRLSGAMLASATGAWMAYVVQHTGWYHQRFPAVALLEVGTVWLVADLLGTRLREASVPVWVHRAAWIALPLCALATFGSVLVYKAHTPEPPHDITWELGRVPPGSTVYAFSVGMNSFPVVIERHLVWGSRFAHLWMLPAIRANEMPSPDGRSYHHLEPARVAELAALQRRETAEDLRRTQPAVIFVERCDAVHSCESYSSPLDAVRWFSQDADFATLWKSYHLARAVQGFDVYTRDPAQ